MEAASRYRLARRCALNHRRSKAASAFLVVLMIGYCVCLYDMIQLGIQIKQFCPGVSLRYQTALTKAQVNTALTYARGTRNSEGAYPTFWREDELTLQAFSSQRIAEGILGLGFYGNASAVYGADYLNGTAPGNGDIEECAVSASLAWSLWGSLDVIGQWLTLAPAEGHSEMYTVCGVFSCEENLLLYCQGDEGGFSNIELTGVSRDNPSQSVRQFLAGASLEEPSQILYDQALAWAAGILPRLHGFVMILSGVVWILFGFPWNRHFREIGLFFALLVTVYLLPVWLSSLPGWLVPNQWGSIESWTALLNAGYERLYEWVALIPTVRDVQLKLWLLQEFLAFIGSVLFGLVGCLIWVITAPKMPAEKPHQALRE